MTNKTERQNASNVLHSYLEFRATRKPGSRYLFLDECAKCIEAGDGHFPLIIAGAMFDGRTVVADDRHKRVLTEWKAACFRLVFELVFEAAVAYGVPDPFATVGSCLGRLELDRRAGMKPRMSRA